MATREKGKKELSHTRALFCISKICPDITISLPEDYTRLTQKQLPPPSLIVAKSMQCDISASHVLLRHFIDNERNSGNCSIFFYFTIGGFREEKKKKRISIYKLCFGQLGSRMSHTNKNLYEHKYPVGMVWVLIKKKGLNQLCLNVRGRLQKVKRATSSSR